MLMYKSNANQLTQDFKSNPKHFKIYHKILNDRLLLNSHRGSLTSKLKQQSPSLKHMLTYIVLI